MKIKNIIILAMYPYPWHYKEISDTMRSMTNAFGNVKKIFINPTVGFRKAKADGYSFKIKWNVEECGDVLVCTPPLETIPNSFGFGKIKNAWNMKSLREFITTILHSKWREDTILYISSGGITQSFNILNALQPKWLIVDILDDNICFPGVGEKEKKVLDKQFSHILKSSSLVTAVSSFLVERLQEHYNIIPEWLPNGTDVENFEYKASYNQPPEDLKELNRPIIGFVGALTSWIDFELLWKTAEHLKKGTLVLVGPILESEVPNDILIKLRDHQQVIFLGAKPYELIPHYLHQFDVLILPRNYMPHSLASDPLKIYEYMATGKPIVSTALPSVMRFKEFIFVAEKHQDFLNMLDISQKEWSKEKADKMKEIVQDLSWTRRSQKILELFYEKNARFF